MRAIAIAVVLLATQGCAYHFGSTDRTRTFTGVGYDSGLAYGTGMQVARSNGITGQPAGVEMGCLGYLLKPFVAGGVVAALASDTKGDTSTRIGVASAVLAALILAPNCIATLHFAAPHEDPPPPAPPPSALAPSVQDGQFTETVR